MIMPGGYGTLIYRKQGGNELVVRPGGKITNDGTQAANIADLATGATNAQLAVGLNTLIAAVQGVGILATS